jgi:hypothetical protein
MEILEKGSDSEEEDTPTKPEARFSKMSDCDKTTQQWIQNASINQKHVVNVNFDESFKNINPANFEEDETISIKPLFQTTMKEITTLEHESEKSKD